MIDDPNPKDWRELQNGVKRLFRNIGLSAEIEVNIKTPRGSVSVDVVAVDVRSVDKITYNVECKNWKVAIPQSVVHSFTTVMHETGANIGFIISRYGLQTGAEQYTKSTNITGLTYLEFQQRYFEAWWRRYFCPRVGDAADVLLQYVEICNSARDREYEKLTSEGQMAFDRLRSEYEVPAMVFSMFNYHIVAPVLDASKVAGLPVSVEDFEKRVLSLIAPNEQWKCETFREVLELILKYLSDAVDKFNDLFGGAIFEHHAPISNVDVDGPPLDDYLCRF